jgi:hypothetical protein
MRQSSKVHPNGEFKTYLENICIRKVTNNAANKVAAIIFEV